MTQQQAKSGGTTTWFARFSEQVAHWVGTRWAFLIACLVLILWALTGPSFHFSDTWQLVINTGTTIVTFLMVFLIQNTQNRNATALHLKLDEVIRALRRAHNEMIDIEHLSDEDLEVLAKKYEHIRHLRAQRTRPTR